MAEILGVVLLFNIALSFHVMYVSFTEAEIGIYTQNPHNKGACSKNLCTCITAINE